MKTRSLIFGVMVAVGALGVFLPWQAQAVTDEQFQALQQQMQQQSQQIQDLQKARQEDQQEIQKLKEQVGATQKTTDETQKKLDDTQKKVEETQQTATAAARKRLPRCNRLLPFPAKESWRRITFRSSGTRKSNSEKRRASTVRLWWLILPRSSCIERATTCCLRPGSISGCTTTSIRPANRQAGSSTSVDMSFATLDYLFNDYVTLVAGDMLLPLGTYSERGAGWLNKFPDDPLPRSVLPGSGVGVQLRGSRAIGDSGQMVTYAIYGVNGPSSADGYGRCDHA